MNFDLWPYLMSKVIRCYLVYCQIKELKIKETSKLNKIDMIRCLYTNRYQRWFSFPILLSLSWSPMAYLLPKISNLFCFSRVFFNKCFLHTILDIYILLLWHKNKRYREIKIVRWTSKKKKKRWTSTKLVT